MTKNQYTFNVKGHAGNIECHAFDPGEDRKAVALIAHPHPLLGGTMENKVVSTLAKTFYDLGFLSVRFNFRGVGQSEGAHDNGVGETEDVLLLHHLLQEKFGPLPTILAGFSFGAFIQAKASRSIKPEKLVLVAPAVSRFDVPEVGKNALIIHGEEDDVVLLSDLLDWARPQGHPVVVFPGTGHFFHGRLNQIKEIVKLHCSLVS